MLHFEQLLKQHELNYIKEYLFHRFYVEPGEKYRRFRFDFALLENKAAFEIEGGIWKNGRHVRPSGFLMDCEKYELALACGWIVHRIPTHWLKTRQNKNYDLILTLLKDIKAGRRR